jgi:hypothetical protein
MVGRPVRAGTVVTVAAIGTEPGTIAVLPERRTVPTIGTITTECRTVPTIGTIPTVGTITTVLPERRTIPTVRTITTERRAVAPAAVVAEPGAAVPISAVGPERTVAVRSAAGAARRSGPVLPRPIPAGAIVLTPVRPVAGSVVAPAVVPRTVVPRGARSAQSGRRPSVAGTVALPRTLPRGITVGTPLPAAAAGGGSGPVAAAATVPSGLSGTAAALLSGAVAGRAVEAVGAALTSPAVATRRTALGTARSGAVGTIAPRAALRTIAVVRTHVRGHDGAPSSLPSRRATDDPCRTAP